MKLINRLKTGDVLYTSCIGVPFCYHIGIVVDDGVKKRIYHNSPYIKNRYGGSICSETYESFMKERELVKVTKTNVSKERVLAISRKHKVEIWDSFFFNCEDFILEVVEGHRRSDLRDAYRIAALGITMLALME
jgi:hypothetical protein